MKKPTKSKIQPGEQKDTSAYAMAVDVAIGEQVEKLKKFIEENRECEHKGWAELAKKYFAMSLDISKKCAAYYVEELKKSSLFSSAQCSEDIELVFRDDIGLSGYNPAIIADYQNVRLNFRSKGDNSYHTQAFVLSGNFKIPEQFVTDELKAARKEYEDILARYEAINAAKKDLEKIRNSRETIDLRFKTKVLAGSADTAKLLEDARALVPGISKEVTKFLPV